MTTCIGTQIFTGTVTDLQLQFRYVGDDPTALPDSKAEHFAAARVPKGGEALVQYIREQREERERRGEPELRETVAGLTGILTVPDAPDSTNASANAHAFDDPTAYYRVCVRGDAAEAVTLYLDDGDRDVLVIGRLGTTRALEIPGCPWPGLRYVTDLDAGAVVPTRDIDIPVRIARFTPQGS